MRLPLRRFGPDCLGTNWIRDETRRTLKGTGRESDALILTAAQEGQGDQPTSDIRELKEETEEEREATLPEQEDSKCSFNCTAQIQRS